MILKYSAIKRVKNCRIIWQVTCIGQVIGGVLAKDKRTAQKAAKLVKIIYEEYEPIITIEVRQMFFSLLLHS
jgi:xanthine dehydrogenase molybdopterin-binding subunit B